MEFPGPLGTTSSGAKTPRVSSHWSDQLLVSPPQLLSGHFSLERPATLRSARPSYSQVISPWSGQPLSGQPAPSYSQVISPWSGQPLSGQPAPRYSQVISPWSGQLLSGQPAPATLRSFLPGAASYWSACPSYSQVISPCRGQLLVSPLQLLSGQFSLEQPATGQPAPATLRSVLTGAASYRSASPSYS